MPLHRFVHASLLPLIAFLPADCFHKHPTQPGTYAISGHVRLVGTRVDNCGASQGTAVVDDADGVPVDLLYGDAMVAHTTSHSGSYRFTGLSPGGYRVYAAAYGAVRDTTRRLMIASADVVALDTLKLASHGDLYPIPNPATYGCTFMFGVLPYASEAVSIEVRDLHVNIVRHVAGGTYGRGNYQAHWDGLDDAQNPLPSGPYWATLTGPVDLRVQLLFQ